MRLQWLLLALLQSSSALVVPLLAAQPARSLKGVSLLRVSDGEQVDIGAALAATNEHTMLCFGTHAADFNTAEYLQKLRAFLPKLKASGVNRFIVVINAEVSQCSKLAELLDVPLEVELLADPIGDAGRKFGVSRGFRPDDGSLNPFVKLFVVGIGLGPPWGTLWPVLTGYLGNPSGGRDWVEAALQQGQQKGRWPAPLELSADGSTIIENAFDNTPLVSGWGLRPFELATMRLQNLIMQGQNWDVLKPVDDRCLTQLGGCTVVSAGGEAVFSWTDQGLCDVPDFEDILVAVV